LRIGFVGCGLIARYILEMFMARGWTFGKLMAFDLVADRARAFLALARARSATALARSHEDVIQQSDIVVFATTATKPHVTDPDLFRHRPIVLHISLRDLSPNIILSANNVVDDVDHCLCAETSPHLAEKQVGHRAFVSGTLAEAIGGTLALSPERPTIVSPFGMGILDLAVGRFVYREARRRQAICEIPDFFHNRGR
jgi:ornithine cyclodeaminase/alanine dehydrogenase-like protein (mu-crystallin family)